MSNDIQRTLERHLTRPKGHTIPLASIVIPANWPLIHIDMKSRKQNQNIPPNTVVRNIDPLDVNKLIIFNRGANTIFFNTGTLSGTSDASVPVDPNDSWEIEGYDINSIDIVSPSGGSTVNLVAII